MRCFVALRGHRFVIHKTGTHLLSCSSCKVNNVLYFVYFAARNKGGLGRGLQFASFQYTK